MEGFLDALDRRVLVCDGAMGTMLYARGVFLNRCFDELNLSQPDLVAGVHRDYLRAGADVIETNTFGANRFKLSNFGLGDDLRRINVAGAELARKAAGESAWVAGSIGPLGVRIEPWGRTSVEDAEAAFAEQAQALDDGGVDLFVLETFRDVNEIEAAIRGVRRVSAKPIVAQLTTGEDGTTLDGTPPETFTPALERAGADVIGVNCSVGPAAILETVEAMARLTRARLSAQPNAGRPREVDGRNIYLCSPEYMATYARRFIAAGVRLVGGCCGTTPEHIRQIARAVRETGFLKTPGFRAASAIESPAIGSQTVPDSGKPGFLRNPVSRRDKSGLARALADGEFVVVVEVSAPRGLALADTVAQAQRYQALGAAAVNVPDYPRSGARASPLALALLAEQGRVETVLHYSCRDRNLIGMQSDLVGAHAVGLRNVLLTTGTPAPQGAYADATAVYEVDAIGLANMVTRLNQGLDVGGRAFGEPTRFHIGVAVNPFGPDPEAEWRRLDHKVGAGAEFLLTPPIFDLEAFDAVLDRLRLPGLPILAGIAALEGVRHAEFLASEVVGVRMPDAVLRRLRESPDEAQEAMNVTLELAQALRQRVEGLQITVLHGSARTAERLLSELGRLAVIRGQEPQNV
jgi:homocysteine S-methyltransferase